MKNIFVTGVSTGIGLCLARELTGAGYRVLGTVRSEERGRELGGEFGSAFEPILLDVRDEAALEKAVARTRELCGEAGLAALINNAGVGVAGALRDLSVEDFREQLEINLVGVFAVTRALLPLLGAERESPIPPGRIVMVSSQSGQRTFPFLAAYSVSKHGMEALSDGLRRELMLYGVDVVVIQPGPVRTPMGDKNSAGMRERARGSDYEAIIRKFADIHDESIASGTPPEEVARVIRQALETEKPKDRYVLTENFFRDRILMRLLPTRTLDRILARKLGIV